MKHSSFALAAMICALALSSCTLLYHSEPKVRDVEEETPDAVDDTLEAIDAHDLPPDLLEEDPSQEEDAPEETEEPDAVEVPPGIVWVAIPGGSYEMGCSPGDGSCNASENPLHPVTVSGFEMTETEITQAQYLAVTGESPSSHTGCPDCPVEQVDWNQAKGFCEAIGGRLPSEAEWEYAARGGTATIYICGDDPACLDEIAWYDDNSGHASHPVGGKAANGFGLFDMSGNVWEYVEDCWHENYTGAPSTGIVWTDGADCTVRMLRGGSWFILDVYLRVSRRLRGLLVDWYGLYGLRCAQDAT